MTTNPRFDLVDVVQTIRKNRRFIIIIAVLAAVLSAVVYFIRHKKYEARTEFIIRNPVYGDRNNLFGDTHFIDYFAGEDDVDRVMLLAGSDTVQEKIIRNTDLAGAYKMDVSTPEGAAMLQQKFNKNLRLKRTEYKNLELFYTDRDPVLAAKVANESVKVVEEAFRGYYTNMREGMYQSISAKVKEEDSTINSLTDTLSAAREKYGIYDIISPARYNIMLASMKANGHSEYGKGVEIVQNIESVKDQVVTDRARQISLLNQYSTGTKVNDMPLAQVVTQAKPPINPSGFSLVMTVITGVLLGLFFGILYILLVTYYKAIIAVER